MTKFLGANSSVLKSRISTFIVIILSISNIQAKTLLTGKVVAGNVQQFTVPWSQTWRQQIKWMKPEGETVERDDLVVLFDTSNLDSQIEQEEVNLRNANDKAIKSKLDLELKLINAEHDLTKAKLELNLADFLNNVPEKFRSGFEKDTIQFDYKKSKETFQQNKVKLTTAKKALQADIDKQEIEVERIGAILENKQQELKKLQLRANRKGTVLHAMHPWDGSKISEGQSVQSTWSVASIPGLGGEYIQSWVNEVDWPKLNLNQPVKLTLDAYPKSTFMGKISKIGFQAESKKEWGTATYYDVEIQITDISNNKLIPGMSVLIELSQK
jgi:multidrug resistance efflux pump